MGRSHILIGVAGMTLAASAGLAPITPAILASAVVGSLAPDIDTPYSIAGRRFPNLASRIYRTVGHRTATHSTYGVIGAVYFGAALDLWYPFLGIAFMSGYVLHIAADLVTREGCAIYYPASRRRVSFWPAVQTGSVWEGVTVFPILAGIFCADLLLNPRIIEGSYWAGLLRRAVIGG